MPNELDGKKVCEIWQNLSDTELIVHALRHAKQTIAGGMPADAYLQVNADRIDELIEIIAVKHDALCTSMQILGLIPTVELCVSMYIL